MHKEITSFFTLQYAAGKNFLMNFDLNLSPVSHYDGFTIFSIKVA